MPDTFTLRVITPESIAVDTAASSVRFPGLDGLMGVLPHHAPMVAALDAGALTWTEEGVEKEMFVSGGFAEVRGDTVRVVTEASEPASAIDVERARRAAERARERLRRRGRGGQGPSEKVEEIDLLRAQAALRRALQRLKVAEHKR